MKMVMGAVTAVLALGLVSTSAFAGQFAKKHPRRAEVVKREKNEQKKNDEAAADGKITKGQDAKLDRQDQAIRHEEQRQAADNGGHITKAEQRKDNRQENRVNRERNNMEKRDASGAAAAPVAAPVSAPVAPAAGN